MDKKLYVLVIEDNPVDAELTIRLLKTAGYDVTYKRVETKAEMEKALQSRSWDLFLSDYSMPHFSVQTALGLYQFYNCDSPFIVVSGAIGEDKAVELINAGVNDYLMKDNMTRFIPVVERELRETRNHRNLLNVTYALASSEEKYRSYVENAPDVVFLADLSGNFVEVNEAACRITGYTRDELLNMSVLHMITEESLVVAKEMFSRMKSTGTLNADLEVWHQNGSKRWIAVDAIQLSRSLFLGFTKDVTERKNAINEVLKTREELQRFNQYLMDARENERASVAMEIHDELGQALTAIKIDLKWVMENLSDSAKSFQKINRIIEMVNETIKKVQRISAELRPGLLDDLGLATAIEWYSGEFEQRTGINCILMLEELPDGDGRINLTLFRIFQEALTNVIRHAQAHHVKINLKYRENEISMTIEDDGVGIPADKISSGKSLGLIGMRERAKQINGTVVFMKKYTHGTKIVIRIPIPTHEPESL